MKHFSLIQNSEEANGFKCFCSILNALDRSNMSVHLLKANLAEDGCDAAQLDVAKKLLQDSTDPTFLESTQSK